MAVSGLSFSSMRAMGRRAVRRAGVALVDEKFTGGASGLVSIGHFNCSIRVKSDRYVLYQLAAAIFFGPPTKCPKNVPPEIMTPLPSVRIFPLPRSHLTLIPSQQRGPYDEDREMVKSD